MDLFENLIDASSKLGSIQEFCEFTDDIRNAIGCDKPESDILNFLKPLKGVILNRHKDYDYRRNFYFSVCKIPKRFKFYVSVEK